MRLILNHSLTVRWQWIGGVLLIIGVVLLSLSLDTPAQSDQETAKAYAFERLRRIAGEIQGELDSSNPDLVKQAEANRFDLIKELEQWAGKYKVQISQQEDVRPLKVKDGKIITSRPCEQVVETNENVCFAYYGFFDHSAYTCIYKCVSQEETKGRVSRTENNGCDFSPYKPVLLSRLPQTSLRTNVTPSYPSEAMRRGLQGTINVKILVDKEGNVVKACALNGDETLQRAAEKAALKWKFKENVAGQQLFETSITFRFALDKKDSNNTQAVRL